MTGVEITGIGGYVPENIVTNDDLAKLVDTSDEWIKTRTGISERRISTGENTSHLAQKAAERALISAGVKPDEIDLVIVSTVTPDFMTPSVACLLQKRMGINERSACYDISAGCTGFITGLTTAYGLMKADLYKKALVISVDTLSKITDWSDRSTCVLFGDGAGAAVLEKSDKQGIISTFLGSRGDDSGVLYAKGVPMTNPWSKGGKYEDYYLKMNGREVFKFATWAMVDGIRDVLQKSGTDAAMIDYFIPHQANSRIIDYAARKLKVPKEKFIITIDHFSNTSSSTIPLALWESVQKGIIKKGQKIMLVGFGSGFTWGAALIDWTL